LVEGPLEVTTKLTGKDLVAKAFLMEPQCEMQKRSCNMQAQESIASSLTTVTTGKHHGNPWGEEIYALPPRVE